MAKQLESLEIENNGSPPVQVMSTRCLLDVPECPGLPGGLTLPGGVAATVPASCADFLLSFPGVVRLQDAAPDAPVLSPAPVQAEAPDADLLPLTPATEV